MGHADDRTARVRVSVVYCPRPGEADESQLSLPVGSTLEDALRNSGLQERHAEIDLTTVPVGVWGVLRQRSQALRDRDRIEVYRPLVVDPKDARRLRHKGRQRREKLKP